MIDRTEHSDALVRAPLEKRHLFLFPLLIGVIGVFLFPLYLNSVPSSFPTTNKVTIPEGSSVFEIARILKYQGYIRSTSYFRFLSSYLSLDDSLKAGTYQFETPLSPKEIIFSLSEGSTNVTYTPYTFPEGFSVKDMPLYTKSWFSEADTEALLEHEGYLFPDTYHISPEEREEDLITRMQDEFTNKLAPYGAKIAESGYTLDEVTILASILEREANDEESMRTVAGILENRLRDGTPLQVDATLTYLLGKTSAELTVDDLALDSPYNTYTNKGLPPRPIANPGIMAIEAVLNPIVTDYLFYLTGDDGNFYYARTFEEHKQNKERYLR
jgi:UPF0755 protein